MGRSLLAYRGDTPPKSVEAAQGASVHPRTGLRYAVSMRPGAAPQFSEPDAPETLSRTATFLIGSGAHTRSYLWAEGDALFQAPLTWYAARATWGLSPGYEAADQPGQYREIKPDCLYCHADPAPHVPSSQNRYLNPEPGPIGCTRCHGDARAHVAARLAGEKRDDPVVPTRLTPPRRADVCDQCHLVGAVRLARDGRSFGEYLPGDTLADSVAIFVRQVPGTGFGIASHGERLRQSRCGGGDLTCTQCHAPHTPHGQADRSAACRECHGGQHRECSARRGGSDCARCHMARAPTTDIPHVAMTDHFIRVRPDAPSAAPALATGPLSWVTRPTETPADAEERLLLGRAYAETARGGGAEAVSDRARAIESLKSALQNSPASAEGWADLASMHQLSGDRDAAGASIERAHALAPGDVRIARATAASRLSAGNAVGALTSIDAGLHTEPDNVALLLLRTNALLLLSRNAEAETTLKRAGALRPGEAELRLAQGLVAELRRDTDAAAEAYGSATRRAPLNIPARLNHFRVLGVLGRWREAQATIAHAIDALEDRGEVPPALIDRLAAARALAAAHLGESEAAGPMAVGLLTRGLREPWAAVAMGVIATRAGQPEAALRFLDQAVTWAPEDALGWVSLAEALRATGKSDLSARADARALQLGARPRARVPVDQKGLGGKRSSLN